MRNGNSVEKFELYILSLWLLFFLVIVVTIDLKIFEGNPREFVGWTEALGKNLIPIIALLFLVLGVFYYFRFDYRLSGSTTIPVEISSVEDLNYEHLTFLTTYIIPLVCIDLENERYIMVLLVLLVVIGIIYVKTDKFYANPSLSLLGFRLYSATIKKRTGEQFSAVVITKSRLSDTTLIKYIKLDDRVVYAKGE